MPSEELKLSDAAKYLLDECRMVLPGIQALFGFQLIVVFSPGFGEKLASSEQHLHILAIGFVVAAIAIIMTPAVLHRHAGGRTVSTGFIRVSSRLLLLSMPLLASAICMDFYLIGRVLLHDRTLALVAACSLLSLFTALWFVLPRALAPHSTPRRPRGVS